LSGGEQMLAIGRALMSRPKLILFDEPCSVSPNIVERTFDIITGIRASGTTVLGGAECFAAWTCVISPVNPRPGDRG
jgi:ABC-type branched-subunit amino acid transport system ATPase component